LEWGRQSGLALQAVGRCPYGRVGIRGAGHEGTGLLGTQAMRAQRAADAPPAHAVAFSLQFGPQPARAVAPAVALKGRAHNELPGGLEGWYLVALLPGVVRTWCDLQHAAELPHGGLLPPLGDVMVGALGVSWPKITNVFFKMSSSWASRLLATRRTRTSGSRATSRLPTSATSCAAACVLRLSEARRKASALNASSYLRRFRATTRLILLL